MGDGVISNGDGLGDFDFGCAGSTADTQTVVSMGARYTREVAGGYYDDGEEAGHNSIGHVSTGSGNGFILRRQC